jgi:hypothetical protein
LCLPIDDKSSINDNRISDKESPDEEDSETETPGLPSSKTKSIKSSRDNWSQNGEKKSRTRKFDVLNESKAKSEGDGGYMLQNQSKEESPLKPSNTLELLNELDYI